LIQIKGWTNYQKINRPQPSKYEFMGFDHDNTEENNDDSRNVHGVITPNRIKENIIKKNIKVQKTLSFEQFYKDYPRKVQKQRAVKAWNKLNKTEQDLAIASLPKHIKQWEGLDTESSYIPHPASWLNAKSWEDEISDTPITSKYKLDDYKLDSTGNARIGYCVKCNSSDFYKFPTTEDSRCCHDKLLPKSNNTKKLTDELRKKQSSLTGIDDLNNLVNKYK